MSSESAQRLQPFAVIARQGASACSWLRWGSGSAALARPSSDFQSRPRSPAAAGAGPEVQSPGQVPPDVPRPACVRPLRRGGKTVTSMSYSSKHAGVLGFQLLDGGKTPARDQGGRRFPPTAGPCPGPFRSSRSRLGRSARPAATRSFSARCTADRATVLLPTSMSAAATSAARLTSASSASSPHSLRRRRPPSAARTPPRHARDED